MGFFDDLTPEAVETLHNEGPLQPRPDGGPEPEEMGYIEAARRGWEGTPLGMGMKVLAIPGQWTSKKAGELTTGLTGRGEGMTFGEQFAQSIFPHEGEEPVIGQMGMTALMPAAGFIQQAQKGVQEQAPGVAEYTGAVGRPVAGMAGHMVTDPVNLIPMGALLKLGAGGHALAGALSAAFAGQMGLEGAQAAEETVKLFQEKGVTPETVEMGSQSLAAIAGAALPAIGAVAHGRAAFSGRGTPTAPKGEAIAEPPGFHDRPVERAAAEAQRSGPPPEIPTDVADYLANAFESAKGAADKAFKGVEASRKPGPEGTIDTTKIKSGKEAAYLQPGAKIPQPKVEIVKPAEMAGHPKEAALRAGKAAYEPKSNTILLGEEAMQAALQAKDPTAVIDNIRDVVAHEYSHAVAAQAGERLPGAVDPTTGEAVSPAKGGHARGEIAESQPTDMQTIARTKAIAKMIDADPAFQNLRKVAAEGGLLEGSLQPEGADVVGKTYTESAAQLGAEAVGEGVGRGGRILEEFELVEPARAGRARKRAGAKAYKEEAPTKKPTEEGAEFAGEKDVGPTEPVPEGHVRVWSGGPSKTYWSTKRNRGISFSEQPGDVSYVDVPRKVFEAGRKAATEGGQPTQWDTVLPNEWVKRAKTDPTAQQKVYELKPEKDPKKLFEELGIVEFAGEKIDVPKVVRQRTTKHKGVNYKERLGVYRILAEKGGPTTENLKSVGLTPKEWRSWHAANDKNWYRQRNLGKINPEAQAMRDIYTSPEFRKAASKRGELRAAGLSPRALGESPRAKGTSPRQREGYARPPRKPKEVTDITRSSRIAALQRIAHEHTSAAKKIQRADSPPALRDAASVLDKVKAFFNRQVKKLGGTPAQRRSIENLSRSMEKHAERAKTKAEKVEKRQAKAQAEALRDRKRKKGQAELDKEIKRLRKQIEELKAKQRKPKKDVEEIEAEEYRPDDEGEMFAGEKEPKLAPELLTRTRKGKPKSKAERVAGALFVEPEFIRARKVGGARELQAPVPHEKPVPLTKGKVSTKGKTRSVPKKYGKKLPGVYEVGIPRKVARGGKASSRTERALSDAAEFLLEKEGKQRKKTTGPKETETYETFEGPTGRPALTRLAPEGPRLVRKTGKKGTSASPEPLAPDTSLLDAASKKDLKAARSAVSASERIRQRLSPFRGGKAAYESSALRRAKEIMKLPGNKMTLEEAKAAAKKAREAESQAIFTGEEALSLKEFDRRAKASFAPPGKPRLASKSPVPKRPGGKIPSKDANRPLHGYGLDNKGNVVGKADSQVSLRDIAASSKNKQQFMLNLDEFVKGLKKRNLLTGGEPTVTYRKRAIKYYDAGNFRGPTPRQAAEAVLGGRESRVRAAQKTLTPKERAIQRTEFVRRGVREATEGLENAIDRVEAEGNLKTYAEAQASKSKGYEYKNIIEEYLDGHEIDPTGDYFLNQAEMARAKARIKERVEADYDTEIEFAGEKDPFSKAEELSYREGLGQISKTNKDLVTRAAKASGVAKSALSSGDISNPLRQTYVLTADQMMSVQKPGAKGGVFRHQKEVGRNFIEMVKSYSGRRHAKYVKALKADPVYKAGKRAGVDFIEAPSQHEAFMGVDWIADWVNKGRAKKIWDPRRVAAEVVEKVVVGAARAFTHYQNLAMRDGFRRGLEHMKAVDPALLKDPAAIRDLSHLINMFGTRAKIKSKGLKMAGNVVFFSPQMIKSRAQFWYHTLLDHGIETTSAKKIVNGIETTQTKNTPVFGFREYQSKAVRQRARRSVAKSFAFGMGLLALGYQSAKAMGKKPEIEYDPRSSDFGKLRVGNDTMDPWGGHQQYLRFMVQIALGQQKLRGSGRVQKLRYGDHIVRFVRSKASPLASFAATMFTGRSPEGRTVRTWEGMGELAKDSITPLMWQDAMEISASQGVTTPFGFFLLAGAALGMGVQAGPGYKGSWLKGPGMMEADVRVSDEIRRLKLEPPRVGTRVTLPGKTAAGVSRYYVLDPAEREKFQAEVMPKITESLDKFISSKRYKALPDRVKVRVLARIIRRENRRWSAARRLKREMRYKPAKNDWWPEELD